MSVAAEQIKKLREKMGAGILDCRTALEEANGDFDGAVAILREKGMEKAAEREERKASEGIVELYSHGGGRVGVMVEVNCETDFVARSDSFRKFAHELALQIAAASPRWIKEEDIPGDALEAERNNAREVAKEEGKPDNILDKIIEGRVKKFIAETCLLNQEYIRDDKLTIQDFLSDHVVSLGENILVRRFERWELGEQTEE